MCDLRSDRPSVARATPAPGDPARRPAPSRPRQGVPARATADIPTAEYRRVSGIDGGHDRRYRYRWEVWIDGARGVVGMDCTTVDEHGLITRLDGFFGEFPPMEDDASS